MGIVTVGDWFPFESFVILLLSDDLIFSSKVGATGRAAGVEVRIARSNAALAELFERVTPACIIVDLTFPELDIVQLTNRPYRPRLVAYGPHVNAELLRSARDAGVDIVLTRQQFVDRLETELAKWCRP